jgi:hypothetical protein
LRPSPGGLLAPPSPAPLRQVAAQASMRGLRLGYTLIESPGELRRRYRSRVKDLPAHLDVDEQVAGYGAVSCGATHSIMERCNFACTSCYLTEIAMQLDELRTYLGYYGKVQITSGEVTLLKPEELGRIVRYALEIGLDPMVMTNGQRLLQVPGYLDLLVRDYGLQKISFHVDTTQKGRTGMAMGLAEADVHPIRNKFADLVRNTRSETGKQLHAAQTVTVTPENLGDVAEVTRWAIRNADAFRILSFLPVAEVGRTQDENAEDLSMSGLWERICQGAGKNLNRQAMLYGHPECNTTVPVVVVRTGDDTHIEEVVRETSRWDRRMFRILVREFSHYGDQGRGVPHNLLRFCIPVLKRPWRIPEYSGYALWRAVRAAGIGWRLLTALFRNESVSVSPLLIVIHKFMDADELNTPVGQERLDACTFKLPVNGEMVSMCEVNATTMRLQLNERHLRRSPE